MNIVVALFVLMLGTTSLADEQSAAPKVYGSFYYSEKVPNALFMVKALERNDSFEMRRALRNHEIDTVVLLSPGGSVWEGLTIAGIVFDRKMTTYIPLSPNNEGCFSACAFIFFAGKTRLASGPLGVHQMGYYNTELDNKLLPANETQQTTQFTVSEIIGFLNEFQTPAWVYERMFRSREIYVFSDEERLTLNSGEIDATSISNYNELALELKKEKPLQTPEEESSKSKIFDKQNSNHVRQIQSLLNVAGCAAGSEDGIWGRRTSEAAKRFASVNNLAHSEAQPVSTQLLSKIISGEYKKCPPIPSRRQEIPREHLAKSWNLNIDCRNQKISGFATFSREGKTSQGAHQYSLTFRNRAGSNFKGQAWQNGRSFNFYMRQINGQRLIRGTGNISPTRESMNGTTTDSCEFRALVQ